MCFLLLHKRISARAVSREKHLRTDNRLSRVLHLLLHLGQIKDPVTSDQLGQMLAMNSSLVRRTMAGLRNAKLVNSTKGHGGGWFLAKPLHEISLAQVYEALGSPNLFAVGQSADAPSCLLEKAANKAIGQALQAAQNTFDAELSKVTVADLVAPHAKEIKDFQTNFWPSSN